MKVYLGFDDTDTYDSLFGTGKLVRWFQSATPDGCHAWGWFVSPLGIGQWNNIYCKRNKRNNHSEKQEKIKAKSRIA